MALGATPSLTQINTELSTTAQSLITCISNAGKTGTWTKQSDFANYSAFVNYVNPTSTTHDYTGKAGVYLCTLYSNASWTVSSDIGLWLTGITDTGTANQSGTPIYGNYSSNSSATRAGIVTFTVGSDSVTLAVTQTAQLGGEPLLSLTVHNMELSNQAQTSTTVVGTNPTADWEVYSTQPSWITSVNPSSGNGNTTVTVAITHNTGAAREAFVDFRLTSTPSETITLRVFQAA